MVYSIKTMNDINNTEYFTPSQTLTLFVFGICVGVCVTIPIMIGNMNYAWKQDIVQHNAAYYHPQTAAFTWHTNLISLTNTPSQ